MPILRKRSPVLSKRTVSIGDLDLSVPGGYDNVKTFPLKVRKGRGLTVRVDSDAPVDLAVSGPDGRVLDFKEGISSGTLGPIPFNESCTAALVLGVFRGDRAELELEAWQE